MAFACQCATASRSNSTVYRHFVVVIITQTPSSPSQERFMGVHATEGKSNTCPLGYVDTYLSHRTTAAMAMTAR